MRTVATTAGLISLLTVSALHAADYGFPAMGQSQSPGQGQYGEPPVEIGSGWYLRGDVGIAPRSETSARIGAIAVTDLHFDRKQTYALGVGYKFNDWFRADVTGDYATASIAHATGLSTPYTYDYSARSNRQLVLANGYVDLGSWFGVQPYVGAGIGFAHVKTDATLNAVNGGAYYATADALGNTTTYNDLRVTHGTYTLAWALMAGIAFDLSEHAKVDVGYRYTNWGNYGYRGSVASLSSARSGDHEVRVGLRYQID